MGKIIDYPASALLKVIAFYRLFFRPWLGCCCRFYPSCSHYAETAIRRYGAIRGAWMACGRLMKCHPWHPGGIDEVP